MKWRVLYPRSLFFYILVPMLTAAVVVSLVIIQILLPPLTSRFERETASDLNLAVRLGLNSCEDNFLNLLDMRLSGNLMMLETVRKESINQVEEISDNFESINMLIVTRGGGVIASTCENIGIGAVIDPGVFEDRDVTQLRFSGEDYLIKSAYFPFWRWNIVSIIPIRDALHPVIVTRRIIVSFLLAIMVFLALILIVNIQLTVKRPLDKIIVASREISEGAFPQLNSKRRDEIGKVTQAINSMSENLRQQSRKAELAISRVKESELRFRRIIESTRAGYFLLDADLRFLEMNEALLHMFGYSSIEELIGKEVTTVFAEEDAGGIKTLVAELKQGNSIPSGEIRRLNRDGSFGYSSFSVNPVYRHHELVGFEGFLIDTTERKKYQEALESSLHEKSVLLQEIHHRVKNNLNIVVSLLNLQTQNITSLGSAREALQVSCNRIYSMALVHEQLYQSENLARIDLESYLESIIQQLISVYSDTIHVDVELEIEEVGLSITQAIPCGLILNELITNSLIHAFNDRPDGKISINIRRRNERGWDLHYADNGPGLQGNRNAQSDEVPTEGGKPESLGMKLIQILSEQLGGEPEFGVGDGFRFHLAIS